VFAGHGEEFREFVTAIGIPDDSWFKQDVLLAQIRAACELPDEKFVDRLHEMIKFMSQPSSVGASERVSRFGTGSLLHRYSQLKNCVEDEDLRDSALALIGNPWLNPHSWSLYVMRPDGTPSTEAHEMVTSWLKQRLIRDFFEVLAADGATDKRRLNYWLHHERAIEDLWLFLGDDAARSFRPNFKEIKKRAAGRTMFLTNAGTPANNAFGMKINGQWIIEFGQTGNACYVYSVNNFPAVLHSPGMIRGDAGGLKVRKAAVERLLHVDSREENWEHRFSNVLGSYGLRHDDPSQTQHSRNESKSNSPPGASANGSQSRTYHWGKSSEKAQSLDMARLEGLRIHARFKIQDNRRVGGALWVLGVDDSYPTLKVQLRAMGFQYKPNRGWWYQGP
jgi:3',5'-cyclic AMP phosphodiesterase CpdA